MSITYGSVNSTRRSVTDLVSMLLVESSGNFSIVESKMLPLGVVEDASRTVSVIYAKVPWFKSRGNDITS